MRIAVSAAGQSRCSLSLRGELRCKHTPLPAPARPPQAPQWNICAVSPRAQNHHHAKRVNTTHDDSTHTQPVCVCTAAAYLAKLITPRV